MTPEQREQIRLSLLRYLDAQAEGAPGRGVTAAVLRQHLVSEGFPVSEATVLAELHYLRGKALVETVKKALSPENPLWIITSQGRDEYAQLAGA